MKAVRTSNVATVAALPAHWAEALPSHGIDNLHRITSQLYRSAQPPEDAAYALLEIGVRTIVSLRSFSADDDAFRRAGMRLVRVPINTWHIRDRHILSALVEVRIAQRDGPVLLRCLHGADRTGLVTALYRMGVQGSEKAAAREEMLEGGFGYHTIWRNIPAYLARVEPRRIAEPLAESPPIGPV